MVQSLSDRSLMSHTWSLRSFNLILMVIIIFCWRIADAKLFSGIPAPRLVKAVHEYGMEINEIPPEPELGLLRRGEWFLWLKKIVIHAACPPETSTSPI